MRWLTTASLVALLSAAITRPGLAVEQQLPNLPALLSADRVSYDEDLGLVMASGHVEIAQGDRILLADTVTYNQRSDIITASGNVSLLQPSGDVVFANYFELSGSLKDGVAQNFRVLMTDKSRFAAAGARRQGGTLTEMSHGVYSPCELCKDDPERAPLWQVKAARIVHDDVEHQIYYEDAQLDMFGIPVMYSPYFSHPDPTVKRKSGFLAPRYGQSTQTGTIIEVPYFWAFAPDKDLTIAPIYTTTAGPVFNGEYRERWGDAKVTLAGSITDPPAYDELGHRKPGNQLRGHFVGSGVLDINDNWRTGFDAQRESDETYLRRYKILYQPPTVLTANAYAEGFLGRSYNAVNAYAFQDTRSNVLIRDLPIVSPIYEYNYVSEAGAHGQRWTVDASALNLFRPSGVDTRRLSQRTQWEIPYTSSIGDIYTLTMSLQTDGYSTSNNNNPNFATPQGGDRASGRLQPQGKLEWRYPWVRQDGTIQELIEPRAALVAGTQGRKSFIIPNEDSSDFEFDEQNLYSLNRFPGVDRVDGGERAVYGATVGAFGPRGGGTSLFFGQSYRLHRDGTFDSTSGLNGNLSDYVGRLQIKPTNYFEFLYRFRLDHKTFEPRRTEIGARTSITGLNLGIDYTGVTQQIPGSGQSTVKQMTYIAGAALTTRWSISASAIRDLQDDQFRSLGSTLSYQDECFIMNVTAARSFAKDRDIQPTNTFLVQLIYKHLGDVILAGSSGPSSKQ